MHRRSHIVLVPVLHNCPNICGVTLSGLMEAVAAQPFRPGSNFALVAFGIDPKEGPGDAKNEISRLRDRFPSLAITGIHAVTGSDQNVHSVTDALGYRYAWDPDINQYAHDAAVAVMTPDGHLSRWLYGLALDPKDLRLALIEAGKGQIGDWGDQLLLLCYHYDPASGRYSSLVTLLLRIGGGMTATAGMGFVFVAFLREYRRNGRREEGR